MLRKQISHTLYKSIFLSFFFVSINASTYANVSSSAIMNLKHKSNGLIPCSASSANLKNVKRGKQLVAEKIKTKKNVANNLTFVDSKGWLESVYAQWKPVIGADNYRFYIRG